jgi:hypothetical protein
MESDGALCPVLQEVRSDLSAPFGQIRFSLALTRALGRTSRRVEGRSGPASPTKRRERAKKVGICPADDKCSGCKRGCERVKLSQPATSPPAESKAQPEPRKRKAPIQPYVPGELRDCRKDSNEAARKTAKPPPVKESPIVAWLTGAAVKQAIAKAARTAWPRASLRRSSRRSGLSSGKTLS